MKHGQRANTYERSRSAVPGAHSTHCRSDVAVKLATMKLPGRHTLRETQAL